jgi:outer membrane protein assembly factor BamB
MNPEFGIPKPAFILAIRLQTSSATSMTRPLIAAALLLHSSLLQADWPQFRGPGSRAVADATLKAGTMKPQWTAELPGRGLSSPIIVGEKLFVTASSGPEQASLHVICFHKKSGEKLWERVMRATGRTMAHEKTCVAAPTPCSDGSRVFAQFSSNDLFSFDMDGNLQWLRGLTYDYANASNSLGMSQSPLVVDGVLIVQSENDSESFAAGIDVKTGKNLWKLDRPKAANWTSAVEWKGQAAVPVVALQSSKGILAVEPRTGKTVWEYKDGASTIPSTAVGPNGLYAVSHGITALMPEAGSVSQQWRQEKLEPGTASPVVAGDALFVVNRAGVLVKANATDGTEQWKLRLRGPFSGSPVIAGNLLIIGAEREGLLQIVDTQAPEGKVVQELPLKDTLLSSAAISDGAIFLRSDAHLWRIE